MHGRLIEKISWSTCGRHVTLWHRSAFENRIVTTNSSMIKRPFLSAFGYHSDKIGRYSFTLGGRLRFKVARGYARPHKRGRAWILNILKVTSSSPPPHRHPPHPPQPTPCLYLTTNAHSHCSPVVCSRQASLLWNMSQERPFTRTFYSLLNAQKRPVCAAKKKKSAHPFFARNV